VKIIKQAQSVRQSPPQAVMFLSRAVKRTKLKTEAMELLGKLTPTIKPCSNQSFTKNKRSLILRVKQLRYGMQGGQPASYSGKEYSRLFKEIMGVLK
jgi:chromosome partitioning protein